MELPMFKIRSIVFKYWKINIFLCIAVYIAYRIAIFDITQQDEGLSSTILNWLNILLNLGFSLLFLVLTLVCTTSVLLNMIESVRKSLVLSWLSFSGLPIIFLVIMIIDRLTNGHHTGVMAKAFYVAIAYPCITTLLFFRFNAVCHSRYNS